MGIREFARSIVGKNWSDDVRVEVKAHHAEAWWTTCEYDHSGNRTKRQPVKGGSLPEEKDAALAEIDSQLEHAGWRRTGEWYVECGHGFVPLDEWLAEHGSWGFYTVTNARIAPIA